MSPKDSSNHPELDDIMEAFDRGIQRGQRDDEEHAGGMEKAEKVVEYAKEKLKEMDERVVQLQNESLAKDIENHYLHSELAKAWGERNLEIARALHTESSEMASRDTAAFIPGCAAIAHPQKRRVCTTSSLDSPTIKKPKPTIPRKPRPAQSATPAAGSATRTSLAKTALYGASPPPASAWSVRDMQRENVRTQLVLRLMRGRV
ncbi:hypothetical protein EK21DRAFT_111936 [Setomelanomma holmii]|uniref:Uncharacterized protein n=1 Tax=Setomelanomma holmii TaxID=210430 RepID=A0A9P4HBM2_9PLEO|nr:hypothetical protein EK21DRAFT_111936 [Setomelanomma holmii]